MKRLLLLPLFLLMGICPLAAQWNGNATTWIQGNGTEGNPYIISSSEHLSYLANQVNGDTDYAGQHFLLTNNISLSSRNWTPIGTSSHRFKGFFNGGGHTIDSLYINNNSHNSDIGVFGYAEDGTICNLRCKGTIQSNEGNYSIGGIVGQISNMNIYGCHSKVDIYDDAHDVGGIVGRASSSTITRCRVFGLIGGICAGGIVGFVYNSVTISDCIIESEAGIGGIQDIFNSNPVIYKGVAGGVVGTANTVNISNCRNFAWTGASHIAGGIIGLCNYYATVSNCGNYGDVYVYEWDTIDKYAAGIVGKMGAGSITRCFNHGEILIEAIDNEVYSEHAFASGIVASMGEADGLGMISYCYNSGDIIIDYCWQCGDEYINAGLEYATGISPYFSSYCTTNYCYNVGDISVLIGNNKYGVGPTSTLTNCYYRSGCGATSGGTSKTSSQMQSADFLSLLNVGESPFSFDAGNNNNGYPVLHYSTRPIVTTDAANNITTYTATINGHFFGVADSIGFIYKPASGAMNYSRVMLESVSNPAMFNIDSLTPESYYLFSFFAYWEGDLIYGDTMLFCTKPMYTIVVSSNNDSWGTATGNGTFAYGETATLVATPIPPYVFSQWNDDNSNNPRNVTVTYNAQYMAIFSLPQYTITLHTNNPTWGGTSGSGQYQYGDSAFCIAVPANGYHFVMWNDSITDEARFVSVYGDTSLTAIFAPNQYTVTVVSNDTTKGYAYGGGTVDYNSTVQIFAVAIGDNNFLYWSDGNFEQIRTVTVTQNITYMAIFSGIMYHITGIANNSAYGYVTGSGDYPQDSVAILEAVPNYGYEFAHWLDNDTNNPRSVVVNSTATYTAVFIPKVFHVNVESSNISMGSVSGSGDFQFNTQVVIQANNNPHNTFLQWNDGNTQNPRTFTVVSDTSFTAFFEADPTYQVTIVSGDSTKGYVTGGGTFYRGDLVNFSATSYPHYRFLQWNDGVLDAERTETVLYSITYIANFIGETCTVDAYPNDPTMGTVTGGGDYEYNDSVTITATPADGCSFVRWSNGVERASFTFTVQHDESFVAIFARNNSIDDNVEMPHPTVIVDNGSVRVLNADNSNVSIIDAIGRTHYSTSKYGGNPIYLHSSGVYFVIVNNINLGKILVIE